MSFSTTTTTLAFTLGIPFFDLAAYNKDSLPFQLVHDDIIRAHHVLPLFQRDQYLFIAVAHVHHQSALDEIKFHSGLRPQAVLVVAEHLKTLIEHYFATQATAREQRLVSDFHDHELDNIVIHADERTLSESIPLLSADEAPIVRFVHKILFTAITQHASDIHFEPYEKIYRIRIRRDGILYEIANPPLALASRISARIKVMSRLDITERRIPQDGQFKITLAQQRMFDFRISTCPTVHGEKIVIRILDPTHTMLGIDALGYTTQQKHIFLEHIRKPQGLILVTGPTGSGKTVSLYTALHLLNTPDINILTIEDPVEIHLPGINQVNINIKTGFDFATALRAFLRQDPDIIMVGEMRDKETAEIGIKAAQTGHLVLSTLHTNSAPETLMRLVNMDVPAYHIASSVSLIIAQRLVRKLCPHCKQPRTISKNSLRQQGFMETELDTLTLYQAYGCPLCCKGYQGRTGIYELLVVSNTLRQTLLEGTHATEILHQACAEGMQTLRQSGLAKVQQGITSLEELNRAIYH